MNARFYRGPLLEIKAFEIAVGPCICGKEWNVEASLSASSRSKSEEPKGWYSHIFLAIVFVILEL